MRISFLVRNTIIFCKGLPKQIDINGVSGLGLKLVRHLVAGQLKGEMHFNHDHGTEVTINLKRSN